MSMTKRYLDSLPAAEQDAILGGIDNGYVSPDEWDDDAENEPELTERERQVRVDIATILREFNREMEMDEPTDEELAEWARALMEEEDAEC